MAPAGDAPLLDDGTYDALVVDADPSPDGSVRVDLTILAGDRKGEVVPVRAAALGGDPLDLLGVPATVVVTDGVPAVTFEP